VQVAGVGVELAIRDFYDAPVEAGEEFLVHATNGAPVELGGAGGVVPIAEVAGTEEEFSVGREIDTTRVHCEPGPQEEAGKVGLAGGAGVLIADVAPDFAEGNLDEIGVEAEAAAITPVMRIWEIEVGGAELTIDSGLCLGCRDRDCEKEQSEKSAVKTGTTDRKTIHSEESLNTKRVA
jgi:hypothetical protein